MDTSPLSDIKFANIFSHFVFFVCLFFVLLFWCLLKNKSFHFGEVHGIYFSFVSWAFYVTSKMTLLNPMSWKFTHIFLPLTFRLIIHLESIFVHGVRNGFNFTFFHMAIQLFQHYLLKRLFSLELLWHVGQKINWP